MKRMYTKICQNSNDPIRKGNNKINSTSKITKIIATKKNWREKGSRLLQRGLNPHSNGLFFALSLKNFWVITKPAQTKNILKSNIVAIFNQILNIKQNWRNKSFKLFSK